jgi:uncharacterized membrane protein YphA (DoxX/SURF4 family)
VSARRLVYAISTTLAVAVFVGSGVANLLRVSHVGHDMASLGYPPYFMSVLGTWKVLGAIAIAAPRLSRAKEWAYAGMIFDLTGAAASRAAIGDHAGAVLTPLAIAVIVVGSWASRPSARVLAERPDADLAAARRKAAA